VKRTDIRGRPIDYDAPGQIGRFSPKQGKLKRKPLLNEALDRLAAYWDERGEPGRPLLVTLSQLMTLEKVPDELRLKWQPTGQERYRGHLLFVVDDAPTGVKSE
jgi:hypothetical protein